MATPNEDSIVKSLPLLQSISTINVKVTAADNKDLKSVSSSLRQESRQSVSKMPNDYKQGATNNFKRKRRSKEVSQNKVEDMLIVSNMTNILRTARLGTIMTRGEVLSVLMTWWWRE